MGVGNAGYKTKKTNCHHCPVGSICLSRLAFLLFHNLWLNRHIKLFVKCWINVKKKYDNLFLRRYLQKILITNANFCIGATFSENHDKTLPFPLQIDFLSRD